MDIQKQLAMAAVAKAHKRNGTTPPPSAAAVPVKKAPIKTGADPKQSSKAKNAAAAAIASRLGGGVPKGPPPAAAGQGDSAAVDKYRKMVKMGVPAGAICGKMSAEGIPPNIIEEVLSGGGASGAGGSSSRRPGPPPPPSKPSGGGASSLSPNEEKIAAQYRKMVKLGLPPGAVTHKMISDGVPQKIQDSVLAGEVPGGSGGSSSSHPAPASSGRAPAAGGGPLSKLSPNEEKIAAQYRKMVKLGLPPGAVMHKMTSDGVPQKIQDSVMAGEVPAGSRGSPSSQPAPAPSRGATPAAAVGPVSKLSPNEETIAAPYRKMISMKLPDGAVMHKMSMDGVAQNIQDSVMARETPATQVESSDSGRGSAAAFAAGAAALKVAPKQAPAATSSSGSQGGSPLAAAAAAAAAARASGPKRAPRQVPQNPIPQKTQSASGPGALAAAAVAAAARRANRQDSNPEQFDQKPSPQKVIATPQQMVTLQPRPAPAAPSPKPRSTPTPEPRPVPSSSGPTRRGPSPSRNPAANSARSSGGPVPTSTTPRRRTSPPPGPTPTSAPKVQASAPVVVKPVVTEVAASLPKLDPDEEEVADHYRGLVRDGNSLDAVKEEMMNDGAPPHIQDAVMATFAPPPTPPPRVASTPDIAPAAAAAAAVDTFDVNEAEEMRIESASRPSSNSYVNVQKAVDPKIHRIPVVTSPAKENSSSVTLLEQDPKFKKRSEEAVSAPTPPASKKKKKERGKTAKGTTLLESGAEQHCACIVM